MRVQRRRLQQNACDGAWVAPGETMTGSGVVGSEEKEVGSGAIMTRIHVVDHGWAIDTTTTTTTTNLNETNASGGATDIRRVRGGAIKTETRETVLRDIGRAPRTKRDTAPAIADATAT